MFNIPLRVVNILGSRPVRTYRGDTTKPATTGTDPVRRDIRETRGCVSSPPLSLLGSPLAPEPEPESTPSHATSAVSHELTTISLNPDLI